jgi:hypothetical protein
MFGILRAPKSKSAQSATGPNRFVVLVVFGLCLIALLVALKMATQQNSTNISTQQALIQKK